MKYTIMNSNVGKIFFSVKNNKEVKNAGWIIGGQAAQMILSLIVGIFVARYLGPSNYGVIGYCFTYVTFFSAICGLGIDNIIVKEFIDNPDDQGTTLGTAVTLRFGVSAVCMLLMIMIISIVDYGESITIGVAILCSMSLLFASFDTIQFWFQNRYEAKYYSIAKLLAYMVVSLYRVGLLVMKKNVFWFAFSSCVEYGCLSLSLICSYHRKHGPRWKVSRERMLQLIEQGYHYLLSSMMVVIYSQTDKIMIKHMLNEQEVGYYTTATTVCTLWMFILQAIINSMYPTILKYHRNDEILKYQQKNRQLYCIVVYFTLLVSVVTLVFGDLEIFLLFGKDYAPAGNSLKVITWYTTFAYLGVARNAWIVCEKKQRYLKYISMCAAIVNIVLNVLFIPTFGTTGAALASLITEAITGIIIPSLIPDLRPNVRLMCEGVLFKNMKIFSKQI